MKRYAHHISGLTTPPQEGAGPPPRGRLLKGPAAEIWSRSNANEWGRLLPNGVGKCLPESERIASTCTIFLSTSCNPPKAAELNTPTGYATSAPKSQKLTGSK